MSFWFLTATSTEVGEILIFEVFFYKYLNYLSLWGFVQYALESFFI